MTSRSRNSHLRRALPAVFWGVLCIAGCDNTPTAAKESPDPPTQKPQSPSASQYTTSLAAAFISDPSVVSPAADGIAGDGETSVYISLPPGTFPDDDSIVVVNPRTADTTNGRLQDGGLDPISIHAEAEDSLTIDIIEGFSLRIRHFFLKVPRRSRPVVVRTEPPRGKRDVPLYSVITVVFSEPMNGSSLAADGVTLHQGSTPVPGTVRFSDGVHVTAQFTPNEPLLPSASYELRIAQTARDVQGDSLAAISSVQFNTATEAASPPATGSVLVTVTTSGVDPDTDGYTLRMNDGLTQGGIVQAVASNGATLLGPASVSGGNKWLTIDGVTGNCSVSEESWWGTARAVVISATENVSARFDITCEPRITQPIPPGRDQVAFVRDGRIFLANSDGTGISQLTAGPEDNSPSWSPDGTRITFTRGTGSLAEIWLMNADGSNLAKLIAGTYTGSPSWSPDGNRIMYSSQNDGSMNIYTIDVSNPLAEPTLVIGWPGWDEHPAWSPGGRIAFVSDWYAYDFVVDLFVGNADGSDATLVIPGSYAQGLLYYSPAWSPDGTRLAVVTCPNAAFSCGNSTLVVMNADGTDRRNLISMHGAARPAWSPDGLTIAYTSGTDILWIRTDGSAQGLFFENAWGAAWRPRALGAGSR